ncbi:TetR/AcrR family transcriptional regulator [Stackebrandtia nassauensis]|uniref:Transcriptional regulator, TetR family n=1 Tax=Stackebrandtia nassauensis (strain DSM 44728 / CIP 108903 / NRRL B-16338 / NBRC 102104 / LLR-40K-21) TaxID=446470 RepID=D3PXJ5_STANL|nr:TetR/AcrR family transcriptional regulator [Stackebrandtia nassauensis]ADD43325.1 transcriptional regulator, TetR family [Stackebrandtia nassauensis DSM 44728]
MGKRERTRLRLQECAMDAFERDGFEATTVARIAEAAGVTPMTFFRHFPTKEAAVVWDPFDPLIAQAVAAAIAPDVSALQATCRGIWSAWRGADTAVEPLARRRSRLVAATPALRAAMWAAQADTEAAITEVLRDAGYTRWESAAAAGACLGALTSTLLAWALDADESSMNGAIASSLRALDPEGIPEP